MLPSLLVLLAAACFLIQVFRDVLMPRPFQSLHGPRIGSEDARERGRRTDLLLTMSKREYVWP